MGIIYKAIPKTTFPRHTPLFPLPPSVPLRHSTPLRHSGESRNPEDTFPLGPGFRRGDEGGRRGDEGGRRGDERCTPAGAGIHPLDSRFRGNDDRVGSSNTSFPFRSCGRLEPAERQIGDEEGLTRTTSRSRIPHANGPRDAPALTLEKTVGYERQPLRAKVAELADAQDSGSCGVTPVGVQVPPFAGVRGFSTRRGKPLFLGRLL